MNFFNMAWWEYIVLYLTLVFVTNIIKGMCCWKSKEFKFAQKQYTNDVRNYLVKLDLSWDGANCYTNFPILMIFVPFLNIFWRYVVYGVMMDNLQAKIDKGVNPFERFRGFETYSERLQELEISGYSRTEFSSIYDEKTEEQAIVKFKETLNDTVYYIPIVLLLLMFFMSRMAP